MPRLLLDIDMHFWLFLFIPLTCLLANTPTAVTENDPSTLVDGVSVITGDFYLGEEDYCVAGAEPIHIRRFYLSTIGGINQYPHLTATFVLQMNKLIVYEQNGTQVIYSADKANKPHGDIGEEFYGKKKHLMKYHSMDFANTSPGVTNTSTDNLSAKSQLKNQTIVFDPGIDPKGKSFTLYASDGTERRYVNWSSQERSDLGPYGKIHITYYYKLLSETLPNGRILHYEWDNKNRLIGMRTSNPQNTKTFAKLPFPQLDLKNLQSYSLQGSDGRKASYVYRQLSKKHFEFAQAILPEQPDQHFGYSAEHLTQISLPERRTVVIQYDGSKVSSLLTPLGPNGTLIPYYTFTYNDGAKTSNCVDALGNRTSYFWNSDFRLTRIERFEGEQTKKNTEIFVWEGTNLKAKVFYDEAGTPLFAKTFRYDPKGNVLEEILWGNLSGRSSPLHISSDGLPIDDGVEKAITKNTYESRNLLIKREEPNGLEYEYTYLPNAQLPSSKILSANGHFFSKTIYTYDSDNTLIREVNEDGNIVCKIQDIIPRQSEPYIGLPDWIIDKYKEDGIEKLLKKTKLHYTSGALVSQKDIYDADGVFQYSLQYKYDAKGRILEETNPLGQRAVYQYDEVGNKIYFKDFSGRNETTYDYDLLNRLTKKIENGFDGIQHEFIYSYDQKNNLSSATDPYGNTTFYEHDLFGNTTKTTFPAQQVWNGPNCSAITRTLYDSMRNPTLHIDGEGNEIKTVYNILGKPIRIIYADGAVEENIYNLDGTVAKHIDPLGVETCYNYDALGHLIQKRIDDAIETYTYNGNYLIEKKDAEGSITTYTYDGAGRKITEETAGELVQFSYDPLGRVSSRTEEDLITSYRYDLLDRILEEKKTDFSGRLLQIAQYDYDLAGNQTSILRGKVRMERFEYDSLNRCIQKTDPLGAIETTEYEIIKNDLGQNLLQKKTTDPLGLQTIEIFDAQMRKVSLEKRKETTLFVENLYYNLNGQKTAEEDHIYNPDNSQRTILNQWEYDSRDRVISMMEGNGSKITKYQYNCRGEKLVVIKPDGTTLNYEYNRLGYLTRLVSSDKTVDHHLDVDKMGRLIGFDGITRILDAQGRILEENLSSGPLVKNRYDNRGRKTEYVIPCFDLRSDINMAPSILKRSFFRMKPIITLNMI